ncbi:hypothetical protein [Shewanella japonica]|uniref:hypothetical protein n=1 Tax=Shewanella japonica TaxID=93973 RepID=UPI000E72A60B|nr:hypothetical protein [Shewanella japonica]
MDDISSSSNHNKVTDESLNKMFSEMPAHQKEKLIAILTSKENSTVDNQDLLKKFVTLESLSSTPSALKENLPEDITQETLAKALAKINNSQQTLANEQSQFVNIFTEMFEQFSNTPPCDDLNVIREFANASSIFEAFKQAGTSELSCFEGIMSQDAEGLLHAAMSCQIAGMTKNARYLLKLFTQQQFIDKNESYQSLQTDITKQKGHLKSQKTAAKKGGVKRQLPARKTKEQAIELFLAGEYKNYSAAASALFPQIKEIAACNGFTFNSDINGLRTVTDWLRSTKIYKN